MAAMSRVIGCTIFASALAVITPVEAQRDAWAGTWRGALTTGGDTISGRPPGSLRRRRTLIWLPHFDTPPT